MLVRLCWPAGSKIAPVEVSEKWFSTYSIWQRADLPGVRTAVGHPDAPSKACVSPPLAVRAGNTVPRGCPEESLV